MSCYIQFDLMICLRYSSDMASPCVIWLSHPICDSLTRTELELIKTYFQSPDKSGGGPLNDGELWYMRVLNPNTKEYEIRLEFKDAKGWCKLCTLSYGHRNGKLQTDVTHDFTMPAADRICQREHRLSEIISGNDRQLLLPIILSRERPSQSYSRLTGILITSD